jgi:hypothetical protein
MSKFSSSYDNYAQIGYDFFETADKELSNILGA